MAQTSDSSGMMIAEWIAQAETEALPQSTRVYKKKLTSPITEREADSDEQNEKEGLGDSLVMSNSKQSAANGD